MILVIVFMVHLVVDNLPLSCNFLGPSLEDIAEEEQPEEEEDGDIGEEDDEMADFIVDEDDIVDVDGFPMRYNLHELSFVL